jgi:cephalosporin hydroxylase
MEAIGEFIRRNSDLLVADSTRETKFGCTFAPRGYFTKK